MTSVLGKRSHESYMSAGELLSLRDRADVTVECRDDSMRPIGSVASQPDAFLPSKILTEHFKPARHDSRRC